ncbi:YihY/virulence factor BrkB family protein [Kitasatospora acidiphila]|uniref:YihY/virulence factor BrkB family protein n=1 Tax=Kitasatospora acidiphila TaxID=2567942 RepID=A0A540WAL2_9ACTN|nr:YhjD/YihY/BrkB family envelope integrity protein [Kitasatospora acidiphila]TQF06063.1 YihY/virulence factor BrkB family protein [Kitasatospora acidiphila]
MRFEDHWGVRQVRRIAESAQEWFADSWIETLWNRLQSLGFINRGMLFAATLLLCFFPFMIVADALAGRSAVSRMSRRLGLNHQAATDVQGLFASSTATNNAVAGAASVFFVVGGIAAAAALQELYQQIFGLQGRGVRDMPHQLLALAVLVAGVALSAWASPVLHHAGGPVLLGIIGTVGVTAYWWLTMWLLLAGRIPWRELFPSACATGLYYLGMVVVLSFFASDMVTSDSREYGPIGVVFSLMSWLIALGVVIILGAVTGIVWQEHELSFAAAFRRLRRQG